MFIDFNMLNQPFNPGMKPIVSHLDLDIFLVGRLLIAASTSALVIGLFRVSASSWFSLGRVQVSRNLSFSSRFMCIELFVVISDGSLCFCGIGGHIPFIIFCWIY